MTNEHQKKTKSPSARRIDIFVFDGMNLLDVAGPAQAFEAATYSSPGAYRLNYVSLNGVSVRASCGLKVEADAPISGRQTGNDLLIPGGSGVNAQIADQQVLKLVKKYREGGGRIISICSGALILAAAGMLNGMKATTHWSRLNQTKDYPEVTWDLDRISAGEGQVHTSAGVTTGIDLALSLIRSDCGSPTALSVARDLVVQPHRLGGQRQFAIYESADRGQTDAISKLLARVTTKPALNWTLETLADAAALHPRTLTRRFKKALGETPAHAVERIRADHARLLIEDNVPLHKAAAEAGFRDVQRLRRAFQRQFDVQPAQYQRVFAQRM
ncbi:MAG: DJ-1/PfpI family protein [Pseudomonadota bacterium]